MIRVSVLIPTRNRPALLREALWSLYGQTMKDYEVLVLNDGGESPDLRPWPLMTVRTFDLPARGQSATLNEGISRSTGMYITVAEDDDLMLPTKLEVLSAALDKAGPEVGAVYSLAQYTDEDGNDIENPPRLRRYFDKHPVITWADVQTDGLFIHGTGTMYRRAALESVGGWDETLQTAEEWDLHLRLLHHGWTFQAVDAVTVTYRRHQGGKSQNRFARRKLRVGVMARIYAKLGLGPPVASGAPND